MRCFTNSRLVSLGFVFVLICGFQEPSSYAVDDPASIAKAETQSVSTIETEQEPEPNGQAPEDKIAAADFPIPEGAKDVTRDFEMITFRTDEVEKNAKAIQTALGKLDWKPQGDQVIESDMAYLKYQKGSGKISITLNLDDRQDPPVHVVIHGDGILFPNSGEFLGVTADEMEGFDDGFEIPTEFKGLPLPKQIEPPTTTRSQFRSELMTNTKSDLKTVHEFFVQEAKKTQWKITSKSIDPKKEASLHLTNKVGEMLVELTNQAGEVEINLAFRDPAKAKEKGFLPPADKGRLILANASKVETTIEINGVTYKLKPEQGAEDPSAGIKLDVLPGNFHYTITANGRETESEKIKVVIGATWGLIVFPEQGHLAEQMY